MTYDLVQCNEVWTATHWPMARCNAIAFGQQGIAPAPCCQRIKILVRKMRFIWDSHNSSAIQTQSIQSQIFIAKLMKVYAEEKKVTLNELLTEH